MEKDNFSDEFIKLDLSDETLKIYTVNSFKDESKNN